MRSSVRKLKEDLLKLETTKLKESFYESFSILGNFINFFKYLNYAIQISWFCFRTF